MTPLRRVVDFAVILTLVALPSRAAADPVTFETRTSFTAAFGSVLVDDFSHSGYRVGDFRNSTDLVRISVPGWTRPARSISTI